MEFISQVRSSNMIVIGNHFSVVRTSIPKAKPCGFFFKAGPALGRGAGQLTMRPTAEVKGGGAGTSNRSLTRAKHIKKT